ncbi:flagellar FlbD family protein [Silvibacterium acidisoli]|uniref:flagellar FlbD family protein n=1 Tax=Acidobacteriaceae bacterium ZG23-2 TaxID=2883246 RepID=UPI00406D4845
MIQLTRFNGSVLAVNDDLIQYVESNPDTTLTLLGGEKLVVRESLGEVMDGIAEVHARELAAALQKSFEE